MSGAPKVRSLNVSDSEARPVLVPGGNKARSMATARKPASKPPSKTESTEIVAAEGKKKASSPSADLPHFRSSFSAPSVIRRHEMLLQSNLSLNASCSSDASTDSFCSRASIGKIGRTSLTNKRRQSTPRIGKTLDKAEKNVSDDSAVPPPEVVQGKKKCAWVTPNTEPCYASFHDEEWGIPVHDDRKLFELLVLSGALAELTWPVILSKRHIFREVFLDFDPVAVSKLNEKKILVPGSTSSSLLSEPKLRAIIENARQILKITDEFGSFDKYCWSFVNYKPIVSKFRYPRQVPVKTPKADVISKDLVKRGFRSVGPTVIYSFMQSSGLTNDHLISCFRFQECVAALLPVIEAAITALCSFHNIKVVVMLFFALEEVTFASMHQCLILCTQKEVTKVGRSARFLEAFLTETTTSNLTNKQSNDVDGSVIQGAKYFTKQRLYHHVSQLKSVSSLPRWILRS